MSDLPCNAPDASSTRVFLSYARGDDEPFVKRLHADLTAAGFTVWFDRESLRSRGIAFPQEIKDAILKETERIIYVGGPNAALSDYVRAERQFALECDHVVVTPILRHGDYGHVPGELSLLHCEDFRDDPKYPALLGKMVANLLQSYPACVAWIAAGQKLTEDDTFASLAQGQGELPQLMATTEWVFDADGLERSEQISLELFFWWYARVPKLLVICINEERQHLEGELCAALRAAQRMVVGHALPELDEGGEVSSVVRFCTHTSPTNAVNISSRKLKRSFSTICSRTILNGL